mmetsp:Transcript_127755/g.208125  ORF Transcript_127755/g.208125 Transcript_127755/m.208125 type:complete len:207 (+) Transcript_127755:2-622(+)
MSWLVKSNYTQGQLIKLNSSGAIVWTKNAGSKYSVSSLAIDAENYIYITGMIWYAIDWEEGMTTTVWKSHIMFLQKYDTSGNLQWERLQSCVGPIDLANYHDETLSARFINVRRDSVLIGGHTTCKCGKQTNATKQYTVIMNYSSQGLWQGTFELDLPFANASWETHMTGFAVGPSQGLYSVHVVNPGPMVWGSLDPDAYLIKYRF